MNEQQLADLFSEQLDKILAGNAVETPPAELSDLLNMGQKIVHVRFQPSAAAQTAFQAQMAGWFGSAGATGLALSNGMLMSIVVLVGSGIGLIALLASLWGNGWQNNSDSQVPESSLPAVATPVETPPPAEHAPEISVPAKPTTIRAATEGDTLPAFSATGDTVSITATPLQETLPLPASTPGVVPTMTTDNNQPDEEDQSDAPQKEGDHDRGHGNDLDGVDEDNPGNSSGVGVGNDKDKEEKENNGRKDR